MAEIIRMPRLSDTMEEGNIVGWLKQEGDDVKVGDILAEVETDKATMELESFFDGTLLYVGLKEGPVPVDGIIAIIGKKGEDVKALLAEAEKESPKVEEAAPEVAQATEVKITATATAASPAPIAHAPVETVADTGMIKASPLAKKMAAEAGISLSGVTGTGEGGRIIKRDIENYKPGAAQSNGSASLAIPTLADFEYGDHSISQMRKVIAKRLGESKYSAPHFYLTVELNMDAAIEARKAINALAPPKISFNDFVIKAAANALRKHPHINGSWLGDKMTFHKDINVGVAVAVDEGLVVPVIRNTDLKSLSMINEEVKSLAGKARDKKITPQEMQGNTFTISNLGMFGIEEFTAIINPPDACILAVGTIVQKPVVDNGEIKIGNRMKVTLSCDHRIVDGAKGAQFLQTFKQFMENPVRMLV